jgi:SagB-type dehydrogenase family enzyme
MKSRSGIIAVSCSAFMILSTIPSLAVDKLIQLPKPRLKGTMSVEAAIVAKRTERNYSRKPLTMAEVSQILWAGNGDLPLDAVSGPSRKVIPSAGGLYPLELFLVAGQGTIKNLPAGIYQYMPRGNQLRLTVPGDQRGLLAHAAFSQMWLARAPAVVVIAGVMARTTVKYGSRGVNYVLMEAGNCDQNIYLQAYALGLAAGTVGAFHDANVSGVLKLPGGVNPMLLVAIGKK